MKKLMNVLLAVAVLAGAFMLSGCGEGADEFFGGYNMYRNVHLCYYADNMVRVRIII